MAPYCTPLEIMKKTLLFTIVLLTGIHLSVFGQAPVIQSVHPLNAFPNDTIIITGSGFSTNPSDMEVWFDQVKGTISASSEFAIEAIVPAQARMNVVEVINRGSKLSAKSNLKFMPSFGGGPFNIGDFAAPLKFTANEELWDLSTADLNADGKPDIVATKFASSGFVSSTDLMILHNTSIPGTLSFNKFDKLNMPVLNLTFPTDNVITADLQGDGLPEIIVCRGGSTRNSVHILRNSSTAGGTIGFASPIALLLEPGHVATRLVARDLNKDGKPELVVSNSFNDIVYVFVNQSSGGTNISFNATPLKLSIKVFASDESSINYEVEAQDFNGDDLPDLVVNEFQDDSLHIFKNTSVGALSFATRVTIATTEKLNRLNTADVNSDGKPDLICTSTLSNKVLVYMNESTTSTISFAAAPISLVSSLGAWGVDVADIDGDNDPDIINANRDEPAINIFTHNGNFSSPGFTSNTFATSDDTRNIKVADMDGDGKPDIVFTSFTTSLPKTSALQIVRNTHCHNPDILNDNDLQAGDQFTICNGQTIRLETIPADGVTFTWEKNGTDTGDDKSFLNITAPGAAGTYTVTATGENGNCVVQSAALSVIEDSGTAPANPSITANTPLCSGALLQLSTAVVPGGIYHWTGPNGFTASTQNPTIANITTNHAGEYTLQISVDVCKSNIVSKRVDVADLADFTITSNDATNTVCEGGSVILSVNNLANHSYQWKKDGANISISGESATYTATEEGDYTVEIRNITLDCTKEIGPVMVTVLTAPIAGYQVDVTACTEEEIAFTNQSTTDSRATVINNWDFGDGSNTQETSPLKSYSTAQTFNTSLTVNYQGVSGCSDIAFIPVTVTANTLPVITSTETSLCPDSTVTLSLNGTFTTTLWSNSDTGNSTVVTGPGTYTVNTTDVNGCLGEAQIIITAKDVPVLTVTAMPEVIVPGATSQLSVEGAETYVWSPVETLDEADIPNPVAIPTVTTLYTVRGTNADGCAADAQIEVTVEGMSSFPAAFSPNGDGNFDTWNIGAPDKPECTLSVFDARGRKIFESRGQNWDGQAVPKGTYYYVFGCPAEKPITGNVLLIK